jgi:hypothetical protein
LYAQHDFFEHVPFRELRVRVRCSFKRIRCGDRDFQPRLRDRQCEALELSNAGFSVVRKHTNAASFSRRRLDAVWKCDPAAALYRIEQMCEWPSPCERQHRIETVGSEANCRLRKVLVTSIGRGIGTEAADESDAVGSGRGCQHTRAAHLRELERQASDRARSAVDRDRLATFDPQRIIYAL